ncbi:MAG: Lrp/AsnC family transcriptional regulator [bacterium]
MDKLLKLLKQNALETPANLAKLLDIPEAEVRAKIEKYEKSGIILGYQAIVNEDSLNLKRVSAVIEVKTTPEREGGFDRLAGRLAKFPEVEALYLMSGGYDLLVFISGNDLKEVASFVAEKLATMTGVISTSTHFMLRTYKERGVLMETKHEQERLTVSP